MNLLKKINFFPSLLVYLLPLSFIAGNLMINLSLAIITLYGLIRYYKEIFLWENKLLLSALIAFFVLIIFSTNQETISSSINPEWKKSILFLRYFLFILVLRCMVINRHLNLNTFLVSTFIIVGLVSVDIIIQFIFGKNILGFEPVPYPPYTKWYSGIFRDEVIAGGYILMFSILGVFAIPNIIKKNKSIVSVAFLIILSLFLVSIVLAGNRMPSIMFVFFLFLFSIILRKKNTKFFNFFFFLFSIIAVTFFTFNIDKFKNVDPEKSSNLQRVYSNFIAGIPNPKIIIEELKKDYPSLKKYENSGRQFHTLKEFKTTENYKKYSVFTGHLAIYITAIDLFLDKPIIGSGIKSFRNLCKNKIHLPNRVCENHPHNFTLELLNDTGIVGFLLFFFSILYSLVLNYKNYSFSEMRRDDISNWIFLALILSLIIQIFPFKSSGSFFSTYNATYTFLLLGLSIGLNEMKKSK